MNHRLKKRLERFDRLSWQARETMAVTALFEVGVFGALRGGPATAAELAARLGTGARRLRQFLDVAVLGGFLDREAERYRLVAGDEEIFDPDGPHVGALGLGGWDRFFGRLARAVEVLRTDRALSAAGSGGDVPEEDRRSFLLYLHARSLPVAAEVGALLCREPVRHVVDLGSGAGTYSFEILRRCPGARATLVDRENATPVIEECARAAGVADRVDVRPGDFFTSDWGTGHDLVLVGNIVHCYDPDRDRALVARVFERLCPGGRIAVKDFVVDDDRLGPPAGIRFAALMAMMGNEGDTYPEAAVAGWLRQAGFVPDITYALSSAPESYLMIARRPATGSAPTAA